jgi:4-carboxymuconolactone decarboxylase
LKQDTMTAEQRAVYQEIASGPHARVVGPFLAWVHVPELARRARNLSEYIRFQAKLPRKLAELAILVTGRHWEAEFEYYAHAKLAREAGVSDAIIAAIAEGRRPEQMSAEETAVYDLCAEIYAHRRVSEPTYQRAVKALGLQQVVELVATTGYYSMVSIALNTFRIPLPPGEPSPFGK